MALSTRFTELFGVQHPIALAPMGGSAGGALAAAVSRGGGLGLLGAGGGDPEWLARGRATRRPTSCSSTSTARRWTP
ncbi:nitronate monooxygenase [Streptomyces avermitilis]|uniref:nitronate monooxygenase n=1 Tax=Streptomyces avermitilis TaxID=33903 RepID=UPI0037218157